MKFRNIFILFSFFLFAFFIGSCNKSSDSTGPDPATPETAVVKVNSGSFGTVKTPSGYSLTVIPGAVPQTGTSTNADVTFSIETPVEPPKAISSNATLKSNVVKIGPEGFNFRWPIRITFPYGNADPADVRIIYFDALKDKWIVIPASEVDITAKTISADVINLGYFAAVQITGSSFPKTNANDSDGGFEFDGEYGYYYTLTVKSVSNYKFPYQALWSNSGPGASGSTGSQIGGTGPKPPTHIILLQATYEIWISRTVPGTLSSLPKIYTYTIPATGTINNPLTYSAVNQGWTKLMMPSGGSWLEGTPDSWPTPTNTYGTGEFQATLNWVNTTSANADVDLHLYGPNNLHVYWESQTSSDGTVQLDRDWTHNLGNAVENIYSLSKMKPGTYTLKVNLYDLNSGSSKNYSVRVIRAADVKNYTGTVSTPNDSDDETKMITIQQFIVQ